MTCGATRNATSLPAPGSGASQLDLLDGLTIATSGQPPAPARAKASRVVASVPMIQGICGRTYIESSVPSGPLELWENRLRQRLARIGSTECALIWRQKTTPQGRSISRLAPSTRHTNGSGSGGSLWPTPKSSPAGPDFAKVERSDTGLSLQTVMAATVYWSTPRASDGDKGAPRQQFGGGGQPLPAQMYANTSLWVTPSARDWKDSAGMSLAPRKDGASRIDLLPRQMIATEAGGATENGSSATTKKRGAPNPAFPCWLMGWPDELLSGALRAIQSFRSSRPKSSRRSPTLKP